MSDQNQALMAAQLRAQAAANYNQATGEAMRNAAPEPNWKSLAHEACQLLTEQQAAIAKWRARAFVGFGFFLMSVALQVWRMFQ